MWFNGCTKKKAGSGKASYQSRIKFWTLVEHAKKVFWHHHTLHQQLSLENSKQEQWITYSCCSIFAQTTITIKGIRLWMLVIHLGTTTWHFLGTTNQNVLKIMMLYRNIFPLAGNGKLHLQRQPYFYAKLSQLQKTYTN